jgi:hypothetical protein
MMKRNIAGALLMLVSLSLGACASSNTPAPGSSTASPKAALAQAASNPQVVIPAVITSSAPATATSSPATQTPAAGDKAAADTGVTKDDGIYVVAQGNLFDTRAISVIANASVIIILENKDTGVVHNLSFYVNETAKTPIFTGPPVVGPGTVTYQFFAPAEPGNFYFRDDTHPASMSGTLVVFSCC